MAMPLICKPTSLLGTFGKLVFVHIMLLFLQTNGELIQSRFFEGTLCELDERLDNSCSRQLPDVTNQIHCAIICATETSTCIGSSIDDAGVCFVHNECPAVGLSCVVTNNNHSYMARHCDNGGTWIPSENKCQCVGGWVGQACQKHPTKCEDLIANGYGNGLIHTILDPYEDSNTLIPVLCAISNGLACMQVMYHSSTINFNFNRTWAEYRDGFRDENSSEYWLGLKWWNLLSEAGYNRLTATLVVSSVGQVSHTYFSRMSNETSGFSNNLNIIDPGYIAPSLFDRGHEKRDCLSAIKNVPFSTWDRDNDQEPGLNCASRAGFGWWLNDCDNLCNMLGYGPNFWDGKPSYQRMSMDGIGIAQEIQNMIRIYMYIQ